MIKNKICAAAVLTLGITQPVYARPVAPTQNQRCSEDVVHYLAKFMPGSYRNLSYRNEYGIGDLIASACKILPHHENITLSAFINIWNPNSSEYLYVSMVDHENNQLLANFEGGLEQLYPGISASTKESVRIDMAPYNLAPKVRAFAIDVAAGKQNVNLHCRGEEIGPARILFIREDSIIRPLFDKGVPMSYRARVNRTAKATCKYDKPASTENVVFENINLTIMLGKKSTDGFADLEIKGVSTYSDGKPSPRKPFHYTLKYTRKPAQDNRDIGTYPVQELDNAINAWRSTEDKARQSVAPPAAEQESHSCNSDVVSYIGRVVFWRALDGKKLTYRNENPGDISISSSSCKIWSDDESTTLSAFILYWNDASVNLTLSMVDHVKNESLAYFSQKLGQASAAMNINAETDSLRIDSVRYDLAPGVRAFSLDVIKGNQGNSYCSGEEIGPARALFIKDGNRIRPVLGNTVPMSYRKRIKGEVKCTNGKPDSTENVVFEDIKFTFSPSEKSTEGFADLVVTGESTYSDGTPSPRKPFHYELKYYHDFHGQQDDGFYAKFLAMRQTMDEWRN